MSSLHHLTLPLFCPHDCGVTHHVTRVSQSQQPLLEKGEEPSNAKITFTVDFWPKWDIIIKWTNYMIGTDVWPPFFAITLFKGFSLIAKPVGVFFWKKKVGRQLHNCDRWAIFLKFLSKNKALDSNTATAVHTLLESTPDPWCGRMESNPLLKNNRSIISH